MSLIFDVKKTTFLMFFSISIVAGCDDRTEAPDQGPVAPTPTESAQLVIVSEGQDHCGDPVDVILRNLGSVEYIGGSRLTAEVSGQQVSEFIAGPVAPGQPFSRPISRPNLPGNDYTIRVSINNQPPVSSSCVR